MPETQPVFRVHPAIGFARVGNSDDYYLAPETMAGLPVPGNDEVTGGLPIKPGTESETITSSDLRDKSGALKRQAARFRIYQYAEKDSDSYPSGGGTEVQIGSKVGDKTVADIIWTVHLANKKANTYKLIETEGIVAYENGNLPAIRNPEYGPDLDNAARLRALTIDPGPRAIRGSGRGPVRFDKHTVASFCDGQAEIEELKSYPKSFPDDSFTDLYAPTGKIDTLGELRTDDRGRLVVLGGYGRACGWYRDGAPPPLENDLNNNGWFDDTGDGPVSAVLVFDDGSTQEVHGAWVVCTDPAYAPQTLNVVSLWDDIYDTWVRKLGLAPEIYNRRFQDSYKPSFDDQVYPIFRAAALQEWNTNLPEGAQKAHRVVGSITASDDPAETIMAGLAYVRNPNNRGEQVVGNPLMPLSLGDAGQAFLSPTLTQYFFLTQWNRSRFVPGPGPELGPGEYLDRASLVNCLGGRFSPGIDMTFIVRQPEIYIRDWQRSGAGPFRIHPRRMDYRKAQTSQPLLTAGYVPLHSPPVGLEPGDTSKFMALPWHTDYNSCATHETDPNPQGSTTLYWSWPAQRPVAVYAAKDVHDGELGAQRYSVRGKGTETDNPASAGRYQYRIDMVENWHRIGVVIQGSAIDGDVEYSPEHYLEVESRLDEEEVPPWPMNAKK